MPKKIRIALDAKSISDAISELERYKSTIASKSIQLAQRLAEVGGHEASARFAAAMYDGTNDVAVDVDTQNSPCTITATGSSVAFIEFGSGVYFNGSGSYPLPKPAGIVGIGEYGKGHGKRKAWGYYSDDGTLVVTHGNPAAMPMYYAISEMRKRASELAKEVFSE